MNSGSGDLQGNGDIDVILILKLSLECLMPPWVNVIFPSWVICRMIVHSFNPSFRLPLPLPKKVLRIQNWRGPCEPRITSVGYVWTVRVREMVRQVLPHTMC